MAVIQSKTNYYKMKNKVDLKPKYPFIYINNKNGNDRDLVVNNQLGVYLNDSLGDHVSQTISDINTPLIWSFVGKYMFGDINNVDGLNDTTNRFSLTETPILTEYIDYRSNIFEFHSRTKDYLKNKIEHTDKYIKDRYLDLFNMEYLGEDIKYLRRLSKMIFNPVKYLYKIFTEESRVKNNNIIITDKPWEDYYIEYIDFHAIEYNGEFKIELNWDTMTHSFTNNTDWHTLNSLTTNNNPMVDYNIYFQGDDNEDRVISDSKYFLISEQSFNINIYVPSSNSYSMLNIYRDGTFGHDELPNTPNPKYIILDLFNKPRKVYIENKSKSLKPNRVYFKNIKTNIGTNKYMYRFLFPYYILKEDLENENLNGNIVIENIKGVDNIRITNIDSFIYI